MKILKLTACSIIMLLACNQPTSEVVTHFAITDVKAENLKGAVKQVETNTYLIDSATGQMGTLDSKGVETFDDSGYTISYSNYTPKDSSTMLYTYEHNPHGFLTNMTVTKNGKPSSALKIVSDSLDKYIMAISYDSTNKVDVIYTDIKSNDFGQVLSAKGLHPDSSLKTTFTNNFDSIFYVGGESKDSVGKVTYSSTVKLNDKKDPASMDETSVTKDSTTKTNSVFAYSNVDNTGNWTEQKVTENGKPKKIVKRTITYK